MVNTDYQAMAVGLSEKPKTGWLIADQLIAKRQADYISKLYEFHERKYEENRKQINRTVCDIQAMSRNKSDSESYGLYKYRSKTNFFRNQAAAVTQEKAENKITADLFTRVPTLNAKYNDKVVKKKSKTALDVNYKLQTYLMPRPTADLQLPIILSDNMEYVGRLQPSNIESINRIKKVLKLNQILLNSKLNAVPKQREHNPIGHQKQNTTLKLDVLESYKKYETDYMTRKQNVIDIKLPVLTVVGENRDRVDSKLLIKVPSPLDSYRDGKTSKEVIDECITYFNENFSDNASVELNNNTNRVVTSIRKGDAISKSKSPEKYFLKLQKKQCSCVLHTYKSPPPTPDVAYSTI